MEVWLPEYRQWILDQSPCTERSFKRAIRMQEKDDKEEAIEAALLVAHRTGQRTRVIAQYSDPGVNMASPSIYTNEVVWDSNQYYQKNLENK